MKTINEYIDNNIKSEPINETLIALAALLGAGLVSALGIKLFCKTVNGTAEAVEDFWDWTLDAK